MSDPVRQFLSAVQIKQDSWAVRIRENFRQLLVPSRLLPVSGDAAFQLMAMEHTKREGGAQTASLITHGAVMGIILLTALHRVPVHGCTECVVKPQQPIVYTALKPFVPEKVGKAGNQSGGIRNPIPATVGELPPPSSKAPMPPRVPDQQNIKLPVAQAVLDKDAPELIPTVKDVGLPWMNEKTDSGGPGPSNSIGNGPGNRAGDGPNGGEGFTGVPGGTGRLESEPSCLYCPNPAYTDEARHEKIQGTATLQVLVGADGTAMDVRVSKGLGLGLDERAVQTIRGWHFHPAKDVSGHPVAAWITIETVFRLF